MGSLFYNDAKFIYKEQDLEKVLLDCSNYLSNKSRISMHRLPDTESFTIPELLIKLLKKEQECGEGLEAQTALIDILLSSCLIKSAHPVKVLEYGSMQGDISLHLAEVLGAFHEESVLVCAYDTIEPAWMEKIAQAEYLPKLSFLAGDFGNLQLQQRGYDIIVINGMVNYLNPEEIISDALHLVKEDGILICYSDSPPLLESTFKLYFDKLDEYEITPSQKVLLDHVQNQCWKNTQKPDTDCVIEKHIDCAKQLLSRTNYSRRELSAMARCLFKDIKTSSEARQTDLKIALIELREQLIDRIICNH